MTWTALIPLNSPALRKSRLSTAMSAPQREQLTDALYQHVLGCVERAGVFQTILTLTPPRSAVPTRRWLQKERDLNLELGRARSLLRGPLLILNADLPLLAPEDLLLFVQAAERAGSAVAADRHGTGTNAVALRAGVPFEFAFGPNSLAAHLRAAPRSSVLRRAGLACDLDTPADLAYLLTCGQALPEAVERHMHAERLPRTRTRMAHAG